MPRYYRIDHRIFFLFGWAFYLFTPYFVGVTDVFKGFPGMELYQSFFKIIPAAQLRMYMLITFSWLPAFFLGHLCFKFFKPYKKELQLFPATATSYSTTYLAIFLLIVMVVFTWLGRNSVLGGYNSYDISARGKMSTLLVIFNFFLLYQLLSRQRLTYLLMVGVFLTCLVLLSMGGRMYVMQTFIIILIYKTSFAEKRWKMFQIALVCLAGFMVLSFVGLWRMGADFNPFSALYSLCAEPVFTWFSTSTFLSANEIPLINFPSNFLTSFLNMVPNTVFSFTPYIITTQDMGYITKSPLGADSVWSNFVINFGIIGSFLFMFLTGFLLNFLRHLSERSRFAAVYYILICGMLPFQFFRDGFYLINKQLFFNFLLFPALLLLLMKFTIAVQSIRPGKQPAVSPATGS